MSLTKRVGLVAGAATLTLTGAAYGETTGASDQDLQDRIAELEAQVAKLTAQDQGEWLTEARAAEIRSLVQDVLQDADTRASLLQGGIAAGHDSGGFYIGSDDGNFRLNVGGQMQVRWMGNFQDDGDSGFIDSTRYGFENTRTKLIFSGNVVNPDWTYRIESNFGQSGGFTLEDAWIDYNYGNGWSVTVGQFKAPGLREEMVHSSMQQAVERSLINSAFTLDRTQGVMFNYEGEQFRASGSFNDGAFGSNTPALMFDTEWAFSVRGEILFSGTWEQFNDFSSWRGEEGTAFMLGGAFHVQNGEYGTPAPNELLFWSATIDGSLEFGGANLFGAFVYSDFDNDAGFDANPWGFVVQGGFFVTDDWELFGRFEFGDTDEIFGDAEDLAALTVGATYFFSGNHDLKWTTDIGVAFDEVDGFWVSTPDADLTGWRADLTEEDTQVVVRSQIQLLF